MAQSNKQRQKSYDDRQRALGRKGRKVWATPEEHVAISNFLNKMRKA